MDSFRSTLGRPEYTGEHRCWPCTVANGAILSVCCLALALLSLPLALVAFLAGACTIWLRGYLVPSTPRIVSRVRSAVGHGPDRLLMGSIAAVDDEAVGERTVAMLVEAGVIVPEGERLQLNEPFRTNWREEMRRLRALSDESLVEAIETVTRETSVELLDSDRPLVVLTGPDGGEAWVSRPIAIAETAAASALSSAAIATPYRIPGARALRGFLERCPICETPTEETSPHRCCGGVRDRRTLSGTVLVCPACDEALYRFTDE